MKITQVRAFDEVGVVASVLPFGMEDYAEISKDGTIVLPQGFEPQGFHLVVAVRENGRTFVVQKVVDTEGGGYSSGALSDLQHFAKGFRATLMRDPLEVIRVGRNVWTGWHQNKASNRLDCWHLSQTGKLILFQIGVFTRDNGKTFRLHGEDRWRGQLHWIGDGYVGAPEHVKWGSLEAGSSKRTQIFAHPEFKKLLETVKVSAWKGTPAELDPPLPAVPKNNRAVVQWFITFAGQTGQGPVNLLSSDGSKNWVHGIDIEGIEPDPDGEIRLWQGDIVSYARRVPFGSKANSFKLLNVRLVHRGW